MSVIFRLRRCWVELLAALLVLALSSNMNVAWAHKPSDSYLSLTMRDGGRVQVNWHVALRDLDGELSLDANDDGKLTWGEVRPRWPDMLSLVRPHLRLSQASAPCELVAGSESMPAVMAHSDGQYAVFGWSVLCPGVAGQAWHSLDVDYRLFALTDPTHRGIVRWLTRFDGDATPHDAGSVVLGLTRPQHRLTWQPATPTVEPPAAASGPVAPLMLPAEAAPASPSRAALVMSFVHDGVEHIGSGLDHILFLVSWLLVAVWQRPSSPWSRSMPMAGWQARPRWQGSFVEVLGLVTAFTVAHSLTLGLATFGVLSPPARWTESLIALSVLVAALDNLWPIIKGPRWLVVFGFGLIHGFGFAGAMQDLGLARQDLAWPLLGFNLGVELGQLMLVATVLPLACLLRSTALYRRGVVLPGSLAIAVLAALWLYERAADVSLGWLPG